MTPTVCVFNRTRESFLCLSAIAAGALRTAPLDFPRLRPEFTAARADGIWLMQSPGVYTVGTVFPVDLLYLDRGNRVIQLVEHLDPLQIVPVRHNSSSLLKVRTRTVYSSRTRVGDELLICSPEEVEAYWKEIRTQKVWTQQEVIPCSSS